TAALPERVSLQLHSDGEALIVAGDAAQLHQMFANLVTNAVQAVGDAGRVEIRATRADVVEERLCTVGRLPRGSYARVDVTDTGVGMRAGQGEGFFYPFFTTTPVG